jgi:hypothetical protein
MSIGLARRSRRARASLFLASALLLAGALPASADTIAADGDAVLAGNQGVVDLGTVAPGATLHADVSFTLVCAGLRHADPGQTVTLSDGGGTIPAAGGSISATDALIGPVPSTWADDSGGIVGCPSGLSLASSGPSHVTIVAPTEVGTGYEFTLMYARALAPAGSMDAASLSGVTAISFVLAVADAPSPEPEPEPDTTPPVLVGLPTGLDLVTTDPAGAALDYAPPTATDDRDPAPLVACDPAPGATVPVGAWVVTCVATDAAGNSAAGSFPITVHLAAARWAPPVGDDAYVRAEPGRTIPVAARATLDGVPRASGAAQLVVGACPAVVAVGQVANAVVSEAPVALRWDRESRRWFGLLRTSGLAPGCHAATLELDGVAFGSFQLDLRSPDRHLRLHGLHRRR